MMKNKKGQLYIGIYVFLALLICGVALFTFLTQRGWEKNVLIKFANFDELYAEEEAFIFSFRNFAENTLISPASSDYKEEIRKAYAKTSNIEDNPLFNKYLSSLAKVLENPKTKIEKKEDKIIVHLENFEFYNKKEGINIIHARNIDFEIALKTSTS